MKGILMVSVLLLLISSSVSAQQESLLAFYRNHLNLVNPAYNAVDGQTYGVLTLRSQWSGIAEAPETQAVSFMTPLNNKLSLGLSYVHDRVFIERQGFIAIDFSYQVRLSPSLDLFMGLKVGGNNYEVNTQGLQTYNIMTDPGLEPLSRFNPNIGAGFYLKHDRYYVSLSSPKLLDTERARDEDGFASVATDRMHVYLSSGYTFRPSDDFAITPSFMTRYVNGAPFSTDLTATATFGEGFDLGATYRTDGSVVGMAKLLLSERFEIGFAYEYGLRNDLTGSAQGTNEFFARFRL